MFSNSDQLNKVQCDKNFLASKNSARKEKNCSCSTILPRLCEPLWYVDEPYTDPIKNLTQNIKITYLKPVFTQPPLLGIRRKFNNFINSLNHLKETDTSFT